MVHRQLKPLSKRPQLVEIQPHAPLPQNAPLDPHTSANNIPVCEHFFPDIMLLLPLKQTVLVEGV